ncbi:MAG: MOSC N-terminal beta barrel domain-containing protein [Colwellia sp.]
MSLSVSSLHIYPIKSSAGISLSQAKVSKLGLAFDRRFVVSDLNGQFITGRTAPALCLIQVAVHHNGIELNAPNMPSLHLTYESFSQKYQQVSVWGDLIQGQYCNDEASKWFSRYLQRPCVLLFFGVNSQRNKYTNTEKEKSLAFADGYPLLLISKGALRDLNNRLIKDSAQEVSMAHFRPNIVVDFSSLHEETSLMQNYLVPPGKEMNSQYSRYIEDNWQHIRIGDVEFKVSKPCERCIFTTVDPTTSLKNEKRQPLKALQQYRKTLSGEVIFGQNLVPLTQGEIFIGDEVSIVSKKTPPIFIDVMPSENRLKNQEEARQMLTCNKIIDETHDVKTFIFNLTSPRSYLAGQHINFSININGQEKMCCYTLSSSPTTKDYISITIKRLPGGVVSNYFHDKFKVGDQIRAKAPSGNFHLPDDLPKKVLFISAGSGVTPMLSMLRFIVSSQQKTQQKSGFGEEILFLHSAKTDQDLIAKNEVDTLLTQHGNGKAIYAFTQQNHSSLIKSSTLEVEIGRIKQALLAKIKNISQFEVFVCGPSEFRKSIQQSLQTLGLTKNQYHYESFGERKISAPAPAVEIEKPLNESTTNPPNVAQDSSVTKPKSKRITFEKWQKTVEINAKDNNFEETILEQGEDASLILPYSCRAGMCGNCRAKLIKGEVKQLSTDGLSKDEIAQGYILCCSAIAQGEISVLHD